MESLRFLMVTTFYPPYHIGGDAVHVRYLAKALAEQGHEVHVEFAPSAYRLKGGRGPLPALDEDGITVHPIPSRLGRLQPIGAYLSGGSRSVSRTHAELMSRLRPDVVHLHNISLLGFGVLRSRSATTLYTAHDYWVRCPRSDLFKYGRYPCDAPTCLRCTLVSGKPPQLWRYREGWRGLRGVDLVIAPSRFMMQALEGYLNCPIVHIPNFAPDPNPGGRAWEPSDYYLYAGVYETHKGVLELADSLRGVPPLPAPHPPPRRHAARAAPPLQQQGQGHAHEPEGDPKGKEPRARPRRRAQAEPEGRPSRGRREEEQGDAGPAGAQPAPLSFARS